MRLAVKLPDDLRRRVCAFPFLQALVKGLRAQIEKANMEVSEEEADSLEVHLIAEKRNIKALYLLPFQAYYHELEKEDLKTVFSAHRAAKNLKIEKPDIFLSLSESFVDASLGKSLGGKVNVGFSLGKNKFFLDKKAPLLADRHYVEQYQELLKLLLEEAAEKPSKGFSRELKPSREDWSENPYYLVNLSAKGGEVDTDWEEFFSLVEGENFVLVCDGLEKNLQLETLQDYVKSLNKKNQYEVAEVDDLIEFAKLAVYSQTFVTGDSPLLHIAAYSGAHCHFLFQSEPVQKSGPIYFLGEVRYFNLNDPHYREGGHIAYHKVFDEILKFIDGKAKARKKETEK